MTSRKSGPHSASSWPLIPDDGELVVHRDDSEAMGIAATASCGVTTYRGLARQLRLRWGRPISWRG